MTCTDSATFAAGNWSQDGNGVYYAMGQTGGAMAMDNLPAYFIAQGLTCAQAYAALNGSSIFTYVVKNGSMSIPRPTDGGWALSGNPVTGFGVVMTLNIDGVDYGYFESNTDSNDQGGAHHFTDALTWPSWPLVPGVNCGFVRFTPSTVNDPGSTLTQNNTGNKLVAFNYDPWFCCAAASSGCTQGCSPVGLPLASFLIPPTVPPVNPVESQSTQPLLLTPIYLANHTYQFTPGFTELKK